MSITTARSTSRWIAVFAVSLTVVLALSAPAVAVFLPAATSMFAPAELNPVGGVLVAGGIPIPFASATYSGTLTSSVIAGDTSNPFGGLTFTYLITSSVLSAGEIERMTINDYAGFLVDGSYLPGLSLPPTLLTRSITGDVIGFNFVGPPLGFGMLAPGGTTTLLVLQTNAAAFQPTFASIIDGTVTAVASLAPKVLIPEPSTFVLGILGFACVALIRARSRR